STLNQALPDNPNYEVFYKQVLASFAQNSVTPQSVSSEEVYLVGEPNSRNDEVKFENIQPVSVSAQSSGSYQSIKNLVSQLEKLRRPYFLNQITITPEDIDNPDTILFNLSGEMYYFKETVETATPSGQLEEEFIE